MAADEMYFYLDDTAQQKGPLPRRALLKLLESGLVSRATYVWRHGADAGATAWEQIHAYEPLGAPDTVCNRWDDLKREPGCQIRCRDANCSNAFAHLSMYPVGNLFHLETNNCYMSCAFT